MPQKYLIGVDIGTQGTKTALVSIEGKTIATAFEASKLISPSKGIVQQEADDIYFSVTNTIAEVITISGVNSSDVLGIGIDAQMAGIMGIDKDWNAVTYYDSWLDTRCEKYIEQIKAAAEERVVGITGCAVTYAHGPKILWWKNERSDVYKNIAKFVLPSTYVVGRLAGLKAESAYIDYTHLHFSGFGDVENLKWSDELLNLFKVEKSKMPDIVEPWKVIGGLTEDAAEKCKLLSGTPIVAGCGDSAATLLGSGITKSGLLFDVAGTASIFSCCVDKYMPDIATKTLLYARSVIPGLWTPLAYINGGGMCLKWFRDNLTGSDSSVSYDSLNAEAENVLPGSEGLLFLPHFSGRVCPNNPNVRGSWLGLSWVHTRAHMYRSIMEGIAYEYNYYLKVIKGLLSDAEFSQVYVIGGGAKSKLFNSIKADVLGIKYSTLNVSDTAILGSAVIAGYGVKAFNNIQETVDRFVKVGGQVEPNIERNAAYKKFTEPYEKVFEALGPTFKAISR